MGCLSLRADLPWWRRQFLVHVLSTSISRIRISSRRPRVTLLRLEVGDAVFEVAYYVHGLLHSLVALLELLHHLRVDLEQLLVLILQGICSLDLRPHSLNLLLELHRLISPVVELQLEGKVLLAQAVELLVHVPDAKCPSPAVTTSTGGLRDRSNG